MRSGIRADGKPVPWVRRWGGRVEVRTGNHRRRRRYLFKFTASCSIWSAVEMVRELA